MGLGLRVWVGVVGSLWVSVREGVCGAGCVCERVCGWMWLGLYGCVRVCGLV